MNITGVLHVAHNPLCLLSLGPCVWNFLLWKPLSWTYSSLQTIDDLFCEKKLLLFFCYWISLKSLIFLFYENHLCDPQIQWLGTTSLQCLIVKSFVTFFYDICHNLFLSQFLTRCDEVYMMSHGKIVDSGSHEHLMQHCPKYSTLIKVCMQENARNYFMWVLLPVDSRLLKFLHSAKIYYV
jgi:hypothetical protein